MDEETKVGKAKGLGITEFPYSEYDDKENETYREESDGYWWVREFDEHNNLTHFESSDGYVANWTYKLDTSNDTYIVTTFNDTDGKFINRVYDENDEIIFYEDHKGNWWDKSKVSFPFEDLDI
jgi:hypothetical protein